LRVPVLWRENTLTGHWTLDAPHRRKRPQGSLASCPFCPGHEDQTPPTLDCLPPDGHWRARAFANAFPIVDHHEVLVDAPRHVAAFHELAEDEAVEAVRLWSRRMKAARERGLSPLLYRNDGPRAGASVPHVHAQLVAAREPFPRVVHEAARFGQGCPFEQGAFGKELSNREGLRIVRPQAARFPGETWILPLEHAPEFEHATEKGIDAFALALHAETRRLAAAGMEDCNVVLHTAPAGSRGYHWHAEVLPRRDGIGGFELGAGVFANAGP
jgi:UDPglucose--hexose-1-phosphate uridylyltransferase